MFTKGTLLVDGFVCGTWKLTARRRTAALAIETFRRLGKHHRAAVEREGELLLAFAAADEASRELVLSVADEHSRFDMAEDTKK